MGCSASQSTKVTSSNNNNASSVGIQKRESNNSARLSTGSLGIPEHRKKRSSGSSRFSIERGDSLQEEREPNEGEDVAGEEEDDDEVFAPSVNNRQPENGFQENKLGNDANGEFGKMPLKNVPLSGPLYSGNTQFSRSQTDFFKMLDEKIATGQSLSSQESVR